MQCGQTGLVAIELVCRLHQIPVDIRSVIRQFGLGDAELTDEELLRILKKQGLKAKKKSLSLQQLAKKYPLPAIVKTKESQQYTVLLKVNEEQQKCLVFNQEKKNTEELSFEAFQQQFETKLFVLSPAIFSEQVKFGFKWFYKEILQFMI